MDRSGGPKLPHIYGRHVPSACVVVFVFFVVNREKIMKIMICHNLSKIVVVLVATSCGEKCYIISITRNHSKPSWCCVDRELLVSLSGRHSKNSAVHRHRLRWLKQRTGHTGRLNHARAFTSDHVSRVIAVVHCSLLCLFLRLLLFTPPAVRRGKLRSSEKRPAVYVTSVTMVMVCNRSGAGNYHFYDLQVTANDVRKPENT